MKPKRTSPKIDSTNLSSSLLLDKGEYLYGSSPSLNDNSLNAYSLKNCRRRGRISSSENQKNRDLVAFGDAIRSGSIEDVEDFLSNNNPIEILNAREIKVEVSFRLAGHSELKSKKECNFCILFFNSFLLNFSSFF